MSKRALLPALLGLLLLTSTACFFGGGDEETSEQTGDSATAASDSETNQAADTGSPSPTQVATSGELFLQLVEPTELEVFTDVAAMTVAGRTRIDAMVTINDTVVEPNIDGEFSLDMDLEEGPNMIEVVASVASGEQKDFILVAVYVP